MVVVSGGGTWLYSMCGWRYIRMKPALTLEQLALCGGSLQW